MLPGWRFAADTAVALLVWSTVPEVNPLNASTLRFGESPLFEYVNVCPLPTEVGMHQKMTESARPAAVGPTAIFQVLPLLSDIVPSPALEET